jgi:hypothetical protein
MSFAMTTPQIQDQSKTVTRRFGWWFLKPGDRIQAVKKAMGLKKGKKMEKLCVIEVVSVRKEPLNAITKEDCIKEGIPHLRPIEFVMMLVEHYKIDKKLDVNRIEFKYVEE